MQNFTMIYSDDIIGLIIRKCGFCSNTVSHLEIGKCSFNRTQKIVTIKKMEVKCGTGLFQMFGVLFCLC